MLIGSFLTSMGLSNSGKVRMRLARLLGGLPVMGHPWFVLYLKMIEELVAQSLDGIIIGPHVDDLSWNSSSNST